MKGKQGQNDYRNYATQRNGGANNIGVWSAPPVAQLAKIFPAFYAIRGSVLCSQSLS
jgi:hypothetical protein